MLATFVATALLSAGQPIAASEAFRLPPVTRCVTARTLTLTVRGGAPWTRATVRVNGVRVKTVRRARRFRVRGLPLKPFALAIDARTSDGRTATATRRYHPCSPAGKPTITVPSGAAPTTLQIRDLVPGTGVRMRSGNEVAVHYVLAAWSTRKEVDAGWPELFRFTHGVGEVILGMERGMRGMRVGGRRELVIPPRLGYGAAGTGAVIGANETLVMIVELVEVKP